ncbi:hypothetical protein [Roseofilum capinflatum]|uniref:Uncharacterized protein n=1 Tax=Roseofilum capinflatum BLCC-M114 TaxID=3022440 RepID=A0ABT7B813_9CYAN|nr:hypothetical protein [Roseofilum capinflatum]MDJ1174937.1 hypothetical protein [Roseofilum capinflatum BLCC-M114]
MTRDHIQKLGASLRPIRQNLLKFDEEQGILRFWYQGEEPYFDVFFDIQDRELIWFQLTLRGKCLTWHHHQGLETGFTEEINITPERYPSSKLIRPQASLDQAFVDLAYEILLTRSPEYPFDLALQIFEDHHG